MCTVSTVARLTAERPPRLAAQRKAKMERRERQAKPAAYLQAASIHGCSPATTALRQPVAAGVFRRPSQAENNSVSRAMATKNTVAGGLPAWPNTPIE